MFERRDAARFPPSHYLIGQLQQKRIGGTCLGFAAVPSLPQKNNNNEEESQQTRRDQPEHASSVPDGFTLDGSDFIINQQTLPDLHPPHQCSEDCGYARVLTSVMSLMVWCVRGRVRNTMTAYWTDSYTSDSTTSPRQARNASPCCASFSSETTQTYWKQSFIYQSSFV